LGNGVTSFRPRRSEKTKKGVLKVKKRAKKKERGAIPCYLPDVILVTHYIPYSYGVYVTDFDLELLRAESACERLHNVVLVL
jgi:hypothetical protein